MEGPEGEGLVVHGLHLAGRAEEHQEAALAVEEPCTHQAAHVGPASLLGASLLGGRLHDLPSGGCGPGTGR